MTGPALNAHLGEAEEKEPTDEEPDPADATPGSVKPAEVARWATASQDVRTTAKWIVTTTAGAAAVVFGGGPLLIQGELSGDAWLRGLGAVAAAIIGTLGVIFIIGRTSRVLLPYELRLEELPSRLSGLIAKDKGKGWFPDDLQTIDDFLKRLRLWEREARVVPTQAARMRAELESAVGAVSTLEAAAESARGEAKSTLQTELAKKQDDVGRLSARLASLEQAFQIAKDNLGVYLETRDRILEYAEYTEVQQRHAGNAKWLAAGAVLAVGGAATYLLLLGYQPEANKAEAEAPILATLSRVNSDQSTTLWETVGLTDCETTPGVVPVVKQSGKGTNNAPYVVRTLPGKARCPVVSFAVAGNAGLLTFPLDQTTKIEYVTTTTTLPS